MQAENKNTKAKAVEPSYLDIFFDLWIEFGTAIARRPKPTALLNSVGFSSIKIKIRLILFVTISIEQEMKFK